MAPASPFQVLGRLTVAWCLLVVLTIASRPLDANDLWWDLARGREVLRGTVHPSRSLLVLDHASEASWLGGVPFYLVWMAGGVYGLATIPLLAAVSLMLVILWGSSSGPFAAAAFIVPAVTFAVAEALQPTARLFDLLGLLAVWMALSGRARPVGTGLVAVLFCLWANLGPCPLWGLLLVCLSPIDVQRRRNIMATAVLAGSLTPRGPLTWWDALQVFAPSAVVPPSVLEPRWAGVSPENWDIAVCGFLALWLFVVVVTARRLPGCRLFEWAPMLLAAPIAVVLSRSHVPPATLWTACAWIGISRTSAPSPVTERPRWFRMSAVAISAVVLADACVALSPASSRMGWGIGHAIEPRLLQVDELVPGNEPIGAWCFDSRSAGVAAWGSSKTRLIDHPLRALLGGRLLIHAGVRRDLKSAHRARYRLDDGRWGGWGPPLDEWRVGLLLLPAEDESLHRGLLETPWKLIKLDSPTVPYASGEDPRFDRAIVDVMLQQAFVEAGPWQPSLDSYDSQGWRTEASAILGLGIDPGPAIRQSRLFRAVRLPMAACRALSPVRLAGGSSEVRAEFLRCQQALAFDEWKSTGSVSLLRRLVLNDARLSEAQSWLPEIDLERIDGRWTRCLEQYRSGDLREAAGSLGEETADEHYARAMFWMEGGEIEPARHALEAAARMNDKAVELAARHWLDQLSAPRPTAFQVNATAVQRVAGGQARETANTFLEM